MVSFIVQSSRLNVWGWLFQGNLSHFVKAYPPAQSYYELGAAQLKFVLPEPGYLEGIKTKDRAILKMQRVCYQ